MPSHPSRTSRRPYVWIAAACFLVFAGAVFALTGDRPDGPDSADTAAEDSIGGISHGSAAGAEASSAGDVYSAAKSSDYADSAADVPSIAELPGVPIGGSTTGGGPDPNGATGGGAGAGARPGQATSEPVASSRDRAVAAVSGKGQYIYRWEKVGTPAQVVQQAQAAGLSHLVIRAGNPVEGFYVKDILDRLLPMAHAAGIKVVAYDGPSLEDINADVARSLQIATYTTPDGHHIDALASDIERSRAPNLDRPRAAEYARQLRAAVGPEYPLIAIVYHPNYHLSWYPFAELATGFDVFSPMDYWTGVTADGAAFVRKSIELLGQFGLPVSPIGQAYPIEGKGTYPPPDAAAAALAAAKDAGAVGMSWWSWETTTPEHWLVISAFSW